ncbi:MAG: EAL domain-containing protein [Solirubrobacteraceae bacterium]|jgi:diguanylate cyclase (GGDEF)-like protein/PAS domain S-box-containing protein
MGLIGESAAGPGWSGTLAPVRGLLELSQLMRHQPTLNEALDTVARIVSESLGFRTTVINMYRPETDEYEVVAVRGGERAREILLGEVTAAGTWEPLLDPRFLRFGVYFIPAGEVPHDDSVAWSMPEPAGGDRAHAWQPHDALFATLDGLSGRRYGVISVDDPESGLRPDDQQLKVLGALAAHAALAIESASQLAELHSALARNRAVIDSTLDSVVAIDQTGRLIEFNPAAERTFGYRSDEVLGREIVELFVVSELRDAVRASLAAGPDAGARGLTGRRIETTALRSDGVRLPVELTLTVAGGGEGDAPVYYGFVRDIADRRRAEEQLAYLAYHDALTGLPNRILVEEQLDLALARARRSGGAAALMFVDLDDFKEVNDRLGHAAGDQLLAAVATRLRGVLRDSDMLARQGGDEFLVLLADLTEDPAPAAERVGGKLLDSLREPFVVAATEVRTGASIGISLYPDDAADTEALLRHADAAMYRAKGAGGGRLAFPERSAAISTRRTSVATQLRRAIDAGELELHYQPVWTLTPERRVTGAEALLRWRHPDRGLLTPEAFLNLADQGSAGDDLIDWVLGDVARQAREWAQGGLRPVLGINVSPHQLLAPRFVSRLISQVDGHGLSPSSFVVELTESAWSVDSGDALAVIAQLRAAGLSLALDDFGVGYSSLSRLRDLDFDVIKIDRRMLVGVPDDEVSVGVLLAICGLARACGAEIVAEGIETEAQAGFLMAHGIVRAQGYHLARPMSGAELTPVLAQRLAPSPRPPRRPPRRAPSPRADLA